MTKDQGRKETDKLLEEMEKKIRKEYRQAEKEIQQKLNDHLNRFKIKDLQKQEALKNGLITQKEYNDWRMGQMAIGSRWNAMKDTISADLHNANNIAKSIVNGYMPQVYALNHNYGTYEVEHKGKVNTSYTLYDKQAVERLMRDNPDMLPPPGKKTSERIAAGKEKRWNNQHIQSVMTQSILQGESIPKIASRLAKKVGDSNEAAAIRNARTMTTRAENYGRLDSYKRAQKMGIDLQKQWISTLDHRTRDSHVDLDGEVQPIDKPFSNGLDCPGGMGPPEEVYNCRCTMVAQLKGFETDASDMSLRRNEKLGDMSYDEWKAYHKENQNNKAKAKSNAPSTGNITKVKFTPAKNIQEAEKYANAFVSGGMNLTGKNISYKGIDIGTANKINERLSNIYGNFNIDKLSSLESYGKANKKIYSQHSDAPFFATNFGNIGMNSTILNNIDKYVADGEKSFDYVMKNIDKLSGKQLEIAKAYQTAGRSLVGNTVEDMITHEIGHHISYMSEVNKELSAINKTDEWKEYASKLSGYSNHSFGEYVAESFSAYYNGERDKLQPQIIDIFDRLRR